MTRACLLVLAGAMYLVPAVGAVPRKPAPPKKAAKPAVHSAKLASNTSKPASNGKGKPAGKSGSGKAAASRTTRAAGGTRLVRTKSGRVVRVKTHAPPAPTFQTHPDPERYAEIQRALIDRGYFKGEPNGQWSDDSTEALKRFQASSNLPDDGKISALTLNGLGLGPRHDGSTASTVPLPSASASSGTPTVVEETVGPAASTPSPATAATTPPTPHPPQD